MIQPFRDFFETIVKFRISIVLENFNLNNQLQILKQAHFLSNLFGTQLLETRKFGTAAGFYDF